MIIRRVKSSQRYQKQRNKEIERNAQKSFMSGDDFLPFFEYLKDIKEQ